MGDHLMVDELVPLCEHDRPVEDQDAPVVEAFENVDPLERSLFDVQGLPELVLDDGVQRAALAKPELAVGVEEEIYDFFFFFNGWLFPSAAVSPVTLLVDADGPEQVDLSKSGPVDIDEA